MLEKQKVLVSLSRCQLVHIWASRIESINHCKKYTNIVYLTNLHKSFIILISLRQLNGFCKHDEFNHCKHLFLYFLLLQLQLAVNRLYAQKQWNRSTCIAWIQGQNYSWPSWGFEIMELFQALLSMERCHLQSTAQKGDCITSSIFTHTGISVASHW